MFLKIPYLSLCLFLGLLFLGSLTPVSPAENSSDSSENIYDDLAVEGIPPEPKVLDAGEININIQPVSGDEFSCEGLLDGVQVQYDPADCQFFYICMQGEAHKIECPVVQGNIKTYFNPVKKVCDNVGPDFCKAGADLHLGKGDDDEESANDGKEIDDEDDDGEVEEYNSHEYNGEDYDDLASDRTEL